MSVSLKQAIPAGVVPRTIFPFDDEDVIVSGGIDTAYTSVAGTTSSQALVSQTLSAGTTTATTSCVSFKRTSFVSASSQTVALSSILSISAGGSHPTYLIVSGLDRNEYTAGASGATGHLTGNARSAAFSSYSGDERTLGIVFTWNATTGQYTNATYGNLLSLTYTTSGSANDLADLSFFGTSNATLAAQYANSPVTEAINPTYWTDYGTVTFSTESVGSQISTTGATPNGIASVALKFVGDVWNDNGCWVLANTIDAEAGAALGVASTAVGVAGVANGEWQIAYNGPVSVSSTWYTTLRTGDQVVFQTTSGGGHITTVISGTGMAALLVDNAANGANAAHDGSADDIIVLSPHAASAEFTGVNAAMAVVYRLDTPVLSNTVSRESLAAGKSFVLSAAMSASDWYGTAITNYQVYDTYYEFSINGTVCATAHSAAAATSCSALSGISFLAAGSSAGADTVYVRAENASGYWGDWASLAVSVGADIPVLGTAHAAASVTAGLAFSLATAGSFSDPGGEKLTYSLAAASGGTLPSWLGINASTGILSGTAGRVTASTAYSISVTVTNTDGHSASETFTLTDTLPTAPVFSGTASASVIGGKVLSLAATFSDPQKETLTYTATLASGAALPSWLKINASTGVLSGTAPSAKASYQVEVTASDAGGASASQLVTLTDTGSDVPVAKSTTAQAYTVYENHTVSINAAALFSDPSRETLGFLGSSLPGWLTLNPTTGVLTGTAPTKSGSFSFTITARNTDTNSATQSIVLSDVADTPVLALQTAAQTWYGDKSVSLALPTGTFTDPLGERLTYSATLANGSALPSWLTLNASTGALTSIASVPNTATSLSIILKATNTDGFSASETVAATVKSSTPTLQAQTGGVTGLDGHTVSVNLASVFRDPGGLALTLSATEISGTNASSWLHFNPATDILSGILPSSGSGALGIQITATDALGLAATETFGIGYAATTGAIPTISSSSLSTAVEHILLHS